MNGVNKTKFTPLSETTSIPTPFIRGVHPRGFMQVTLNLQNMAL